MSPYLAYEQRDRIEYVRLNRPDKLNCLTVDMILDLTEHFRQLDSADIGAVIISGSGKAFCSGMDIEEFVDLDPIGAHNLISSLGELLKTVRTMPQLVITAVHGYCFGAAVELAAAADLRVVARGSKFAMPEVKLGIPSVLDAALLQQYMGLGLAKEMLLTGLPIDGDRLYAAGFINRLTEPEHLLEEADLMAAQALDNAPETIAMQKRLHEVWQQTSLEQAVQASIQTFAMAFATDIPKRKIGEFRRGKGR